MNRQFIKEEKHVRRCSNTVFIRHLLMKTLKRYHCIPNILSILKCLVGEDIIETAEKWELLDSVFILLGGGST